MEAPGRTLTCSARSVRWRRVADDGSRWRSPGVFPWLSMPKGRMGPPLRSFAADAHDCIMVRVLGPTEYKVVARLIRASKAGSPLIVIPTAPSLPSCSKLSRYGLASSEHAARLARRPTLTAPARDDVSEPRVGTKKRALRSNKELTNDKRFAALRTP